MVAPITAAYSAAERAAVLLREGTESRGAKESGYAHRLGFPACLQLHRRAYIGMLCASCMCHVRARYVRQPPQHVTVLTLCPVVWCRHPVVQQGGSAAGV
jgi:hypothetical protein